MNYVQKDLEREGISRIYLSFLHAFELVLVLVLVFIFTFVLILLVCNMADFSSGH